MLERACRNIGDHGCDRPRRVQIHLPAVKGQELQHGHQRDLLVAAPQRPLAHQRIQQGSGLGGQIAGFVARTRLGQGVLGGRDIEQVEHPAGVQAERAAGDND